GDPGAPTGSRHPRSQRGRHRGEKPRQEIRSRRSRAVRDPRPALLNPARGTTVREHFAPKMPCGAKSYISRPAVLVAADPLLRGRKWWRRPLVPEQTYPEPPVLLYDAKDSGVLCGHSRTESPQ